MHEARHTGVIASLRRTGLIARYTLGEALHLRLTLLLVLVGAGLVLAALGLREFNFGTAELKFLGDFGLGALGLSGTLLAALAMAQLFFSGITGGTAYCVLTRPGRRGEFVWGKFLGVAALLALYTAALGLLLAGLLMWRGHQIGAAPVALPVFLGAVAMLWLKMTLVAVMTALVCSYAGSALFASWAGLLLTLLGNLRPLASETGRLAWLRVWPNLGLFDAEALFAAGQPPSGAMLLGVGVYWAVYVGVFGLLASYVFKHREF
jgi:ABC-type transport system involved in multi-copper enzyme maturation permease subunit